jgi:hypothetical protein
LTTGSRLSASVLLTVLLLLPSVGLGNWQSVRTPHFHIQYHEQQEKVARRLAADAERIRLRHCRLIRPCYDGLTTVQVASSEEEFLDVQPHGAHIDWAAGVAYAPLSLIILRVDKDMLLTLDETFEHEVSHILLLKATTKRPPRWFIEGLAIVQARQNLIEKFEAVATATAREDPLPLSAIRRSFPSTAGGRSLAYAKSGLFVSYVINRFGEDAVRELVTALSYGMTIEDAFVKVFGFSVEELEEEWSGGLSSYAWLKVLTTDWVLWGGMTLLFLLAVAVKWRRTRRRKREMEEEERDWDFIH